VAVLVQAIEDYFQPPDAGKTPLLGNLVLVYK
jgi:hypothetical protein